ncbi:DNA cytosine methyltransferase [Paenibacillus alvei]|uniref:DNA cytosine methyltransferase n=1 Tax=Paenibacillus alvei TaxID=44250 RepID=UPI002282145B|nr:DNA cytosine methyltransferase [Paenibacillus alvei]MCY9541833.1 DNA cytosine methyltransferase [Paenibacillus alvei]MCY9704978.1 DNA cytosine methyltransferase [Paenibacillus alvei]MCY9755325.1 DNA cytosine methyltransferase [Paenibacillus alvei]MEC0082470.1 DNA cytosine methyltransferase [Paenibacillus alvei]
MQNNVEYKTAAVLFGGIGGASAGLLKSQAEYAGKLYRFKLLCSIDSDPVACHNHDLITGEKTGVVMDLFRRWQYEAWHGHEPPEDWREMTPWDMWQAFDQQVPFFLFTSPPCKGLSGLLPQGKANSSKYQALNYLTVSGLELALSACEEYGGTVPAIIQLENVPRITSRGKQLLRQIEKLLKKYGYAVSIRADHNLGEIGGLGQNRVRFLIMARHEAQIPNVIYYPERKPLRSIGDILEPLPAPGDTVSGGPLHRLPRLQWKTWMRLALIPAGGDWRDLNKVDWQNLRVTHEPRRGAYEVADWEEPSRAVTSTAGPGRSNGVTAVSDPRLQINGEGKTNILRVQSSGEPSVCVTGAAGPHQGGSCIADPTLSERPGRHPAQYRIVRADEVGPCVTGSRLGSGAIAVADPRVNTKLHPDSYGVQDWGATAKTVRSANRIMQAAGSVTDPRVPNRPGRYTDQYRMQAVEGPAATVTGSTDVQNGAQLIADPRIKSAPRADTMGVQDWGTTAKTVTGSMDVHAGAAAVADPRIPADNEQGVWMIIAQDGTWHRPLTTYELAMLQSFPTHLPDGRPFQLESCSDAKAREYIGNAVPRDAQEEMGNVLLLAGAQAEAGISFEMSWNPVWVAPEEEYDSVVVH